ncbi:MAG TPA: FHA domain-containing protein [Thermoanaerobaculia bacterium]
MRMSSLPDGDAPALFRFGEFTFDSGSHLLLKSGAVQRLSPKAQQLLQMLLLERPNALSREEIYDALWPSTYVCETNMASIVSELRRALGDDARSSQYIRTVHGYGYAFAGDVRKGDNDVQKGDNNERPLATLRCEGQSHLLYEGENSVGRSPDCRVLLSDVTVSRQHAVIIITGGRIFVEDRGSKNGTYLNGKRIDCSQVKHSDTISFGDTQVTITQAVSGTLTLRLRLSQPNHSSGSMPTA